MKLLICSLPNPRQRIYSIFTHQKPCQSDYIGYWKKNRESVLTPEEGAELEEILRLGRLLDAVVLKARLKLAGKT